MHHMPSAMILLDGCCSWLWLTILSPKWDSKLLITLWKSNWFSYKFGKTFFCNTELGLYLEEENHERLSNHRTVKRRLVVSLQNKWLFGLAESLKQNSQGKPLSRGDYKQSSCVFGIALASKPWEGYVGLITTAEGYRKKRPGFPVSSPKSGPEMLTHLPQLQQKAGSHGISRGGKATVPSPLLVFAFATISKAPFLCLVDCPSQAASSGGGVVQGTRLGWRNQKASVFWLRSGP